MTSNKMTTKINYVLRVISYLPNSFSFFIITEIIRIPGAIPCFASQPPPQSYFWYLKKG